MNDVIEAQAEGSAVESARRICAKQTYFTHTSHELEYEQTNAELPARMEMAYDGLQIPLT